METLIHNYGQKLDRIPDEIVFSLLDAIDEALNNGAFSLRWWASINARLHKYSDDYHHVCEQLDGAPAVELMQAAELLDERRMEIVWGE